MRPLVVLTTSAVLHAHAARERLALGRHPGAGTAIIAYHTLREALRRRVVAVVVPSHALQQIATIASWGMPFEALCRDASRELVGAVPGITGAISRGFLPILLASNVRSSS